MTTPIGIHDLSIATTHYVLEHATLARHQGCDVDKYHVGIGQEAMSIPAADEDIVTLAAAAAAPIIARHGTDDLRTVMLATETGVDQSKAAGLYLHPLLGLPHACRVVELKQACYGATAALHFAAGLISRYPMQKVLVIAADIAKYDRDAPGEATQGAAATAMLVSAHPNIAELEPTIGTYSADIADFWRPNYRTTAVVDGKFSVAAYLTAAEHAYTDYRHADGRDLDEFAAFCYHQPFTKMAYKAHRHLLETQGFTHDPSAVDAAVGATVTYNRLIGNSYTASLYVALASLLDCADDLTGQPVAMLSYGSGCVAEFFGATPVPGYRDHLRANANRDAITSRKPIDFGQYCMLHGTEPATDGRHHLVPEETSGPYRLAAISDHKRIYETTQNNETY